MVLQLSSRVAIFLLCDGENCVYHNYCYVWKSALTICMEQLWVTCIMNMCLSYLAIRQLNLLLYQKRYRLNGTHGCHIKSSGTHSVVCGDGGNTNKWKTMHLCRLEALKWPSAQRSAKWMKIKQLIAQFSGSD